MRFHRTVAVACSLLLSGTLINAVPAQAEAVPMAIRSPEDKALEKAKQTGEPVDVTDRITETSKLTATPSGTLRLEQSMTPARVKRGGEYHDIDLTLEKRSDGTIAPRMSASDVSFGGAGSDTLLTMVKAGKSMTLTWPERDLPEPVLDGDSATYVDAGGAGIDVIVKATPVGVGTYVVVKTPEAATSWPGEGPYTMIRTVVNKADIPGLANLPHTSDVVDGGIALQDDVLPKLGRPRIMPSMSVPVGCP